MNDRLTTGRVTHGGYPFFRDVSSRIDEVVPDNGCGTPILTRGALRMEGERPPRYWFYNTEDLHHGSKLTAEYRALMDGAERVFDYAEPNVELYPGAEFCPPKLGTIRGRHAPNGAGILFFGHMTPRRAAVVRAAEAEAFNGLHGAALSEKILAAAVVLAVHAHDDRCNDAFRTFPTLEAGARLVAESCSETWYNLLLADRGATVVPYEGLAEACRTAIAS